jgi:hypothetical protein
MCFLFYESLSIGILVYYAAPNCHKNSKFNSIKTGLYQEWRHHPVPSGNYTNLGTYTNQLPVSWGAKLKFLLNVNLNNFIIEHTRLKPKSFCFWIFSRLMGPIWNPQIWPLIVVDKNQVKLIRRWITIHFWFLDKALSICFWVEGYLGKVGATETYTWQQNSSRPQKRGP